MTRIYISYGITKSASTFAWQLIKRIAISGGLPVATLTSKSKGANSPEDYVDPVSEKNLSLIREDVGDLPVVIKTHGDATTAVARLVSDGTAKVFASYRDLRDVALSLLDHGARSRAKGIKDFSEFHEIADTLENIKVQIHRFENWVRSCEPLLLSYDEICFDTRSIIPRIAEHIGVSVDVDSVFVEFNNRKNLIGQFNKGESRRFEREMDTDLGALFINGFASFYERYFPDEIPKVKCVQPPHSPAVDGTGRLLSAPPEPGATSATGDGTGLVTPPILKAHRMCDRGASLDRPLLCVVHIPKTSGSAIRETLISILGADKVYWIGHKRSLNHWVDATEDEFRDYDVVGGHDSVTAFSKIKRPKVFMAIVRDPVKRAISLFNYITCGPDTNHGLRKELRGLSLVEGIQASARFRRDVENRQCALVGGQLTFAAALRSICDREWMIDRYEAVDELFGRVCERFGWPARKLVSANVAKQGYADEYLADQDTIGVLRGLNQEDERLVSIFDKALAWYPASDAKASCRVAARVEPHGISSSGQIQADD